MGLEGCEKMITLVKRSLNHVLCHNEIRKFKISLLTHSAFVPDIAPKIRRKVKSVTFIIK